MQWIQADLRRRLLDECTIEESGVVANIFWDIEKFFDSIDPKKLIILATRQGMNLRILAVAMQAHLAPRILKASGGYSNTIGVSRGIIAGCKFSVAFARSAIYWILEKAHSSLSCTSIRQYVDDLAQSTRGHSKEIVVIDCVKAAVTLKEALTREGLKISGKSTLVCSGRKMGEKITNKLAGKGIKINKDIAAKDLGMDTAAGSRRSTKNQSKRIGKAGMRGKRLGWLRKKTGAARNLYSSNLWPAMAYGVSGYGAAPVTVRRMRTIAADAVLG